MASTVNENDELEGGQFTPFQDSDTPRVQRALFNFASASQGYDTTVYDSYRQGVSIRTPRHLFSTTQPKIWAGNLGHAIRVVTLGQARDFTEYENDPKFEELPEFNPVWYIEDQDYPFPIVFNDGPQEEEEASIEPFTIPFRKPNTFGNFDPRQPKATLEDGNNFDNYDGGTNRVEQFIEYDAPRTLRFFLDEGVEYFGAGEPTATYHNLAYDPVVLFQLENQTTLTSSTDLAVTFTGVSGTIQFESGPISGRQAFQFDGATALSTSCCIEELNLTGDFTIEGFIKPELDPSTNDGNIYAFTPPVAGTSSFGPLDIPFPAAPYDNTVFQMTVDNAASDPVILRISASKDGVGASDTFNTGISPGTWFHFAHVRKGTTDSLYINTELIGSVTVPDFTFGNPSGSLAIGNALLWDDLWFTSFSGSLASFKIIGSALTQDQIKREYDLFFPDAFGIRKQANLSNSIVIEGYTAFIQRDADPFDDTADEEIVEQIDTTDPTFVTRLKELDFDLSEDIRGTFNKKSATAGGDVYGPEAARYGTDSIAFRGLTRGA